MFVYSRKGVEVLAAYSDAAGAWTLKSLDPGRQYILATDVKGEKISVGKGHLYLAEATLPLLKRNQPVPLL